MIKANAFEVMRWVHSAPSLTVVLFLVCDATDMLQRGNLISVLGCVLLGVCFISHAFISLDGDLWLPGWAYLVAAITTGVIGYHQKGDWRIIFIILVVVVCLVAFIATTFHRYLFVHPED